MKHLITRLWRDDSGAIVSIELLFLFVILTLGLIAGWTNLRNAINAELTEEANAILALNQGFSITGVTGCPGNGNHGSSATNGPGHLSLSSSHGHTVSIDVPAC